MTLLVIGCSPARHLKPPQMVSSSPSDSHESAKVPRNPNDVTALYERELPDQALLIRSGKDFTLTEPGYYTPLPPTVLLGAGSFREREDISEIIIRHLATKPCEVQPDIKYRFIGFQGNGGSYHDPDKELLQRIRDLKLHPASGNGATALLLQVGHGACAVPEPIR